MNRLSFTQQILIVCLAFGINAAILGLIPVLSGNSNNCNREGFSEPVLVDVYKPPPLQKEEKERKVTPKSDINPRKIPVVLLQKRSVRKVRPRVNLNIDAFQFDVNPKLELGINVVPPDQPKLNAPLSAKEFGLGEVDQVPRIIRRVEPMYPYSARIRGITGKVIVKFLVDTKGYVRKPVILKATPSGIFDDTVLRAVRKWRFKPGYWRGHPVATWVVLPIQFKLSG